MTSRRAAAKAHDADMVNVEARLAPFFPQHSVFIDEPAETPASPLDASPRNRRLTPLRPAAV
jgi:hypothetical protein